MGKIIEEYKKIIEDSKDVLPDEVYSVLLSPEAQHVNSLKPDIEDRDKYFIDGYESLSQSVYDFLHSGRGPYLMGYVQQFKTNRLSSGFKNIEELVHFSIWVIERFYKNNSLTAESWNKLKEKDILISKKEILEKVLLSKQLEDKIYELTINMRKQDDLMKRNEIINLKEENNTFASTILSAHQYYKQLDEIFSSLNSIENIYKFNIIPEPSNQSELELRRVT